MRKRVPSLPRLSFFNDLESIEEADNVGSVLLYADLISKKLIDPRMKYRDGQQPTARQGKHNDPTYVHPLVRYLKNGKMCNDKKKSFQRYCYICRTYGINHNTQWACRECNMPLCNSNLNRRGGDEEWECYNEHKQSDNIYDGCGMIERDVFKVPVENMKTCQAPDGRRRKRGRANNNNASKQINLDDSSKGSHSEQGDDEEEECIASRLRSR